MTEEQQQVVIVLGVLVGSTFVGLGLAYVLWRVSRWRTSRPVKARRHVR